MKRAGARSVLVTCVALWLGVIWILNAGAFASETPAALQSCVPGLPPPLGCPEESPSPSRSSSASPSSSPSSSPSEEPSESEDSQLSIKYANKKFSGAVKSDSSACERNRSVSVKRRGGKVIGTDTTDSTGKWSVRYPKPKGKRYFAKVAPRVGGSPSCQGDRSKTIKAS